MVCEIVTDLRILWQISILFASHKIKFGPEVKGKTGKGHEAEKQNLAIMGSHPLTCFVYHLIAKGLKLTGFTVNRVNYKNDPARDHRSRSWSEKAKQNFGLTLFFSFTNLFAR